MLDNKYGKPLPFLLYASFTHVVLSIIVCVGLCYTDRLVCLECFSTVGWAAGRPFSLTRPYVFFWY